MNRASPYGKTEIDDKVLGHYFGADDYLGKPFDTKEILARIRAMLRRKSGGLSSETTNCTGFSQVETSKILNLQKDAYLLASDIVVVKTPVSVNALVVRLGKRTQAYPQACR